MNRIQSFTQWPKVIILIIALIQTLSTASAGNLDLSSTPLFLGNTAPPNMLITLDNSSSTDYDIMAKAHWERAAYEPIYASGEYAPTPKDIDAGIQLKGTCSDSNDDCGMLRNDGTIILSGAPNVNGYTYKDRNYLPYFYLSSCGGGSYDPCGSTFYKPDNDANYVISACQYSVNNTYSLADCPEREALDWRVRSADLNVLYYNPNLDYKPWDFSSFTAADFTKARANPNQGHTGYKKLVDLSSTPPLGIDSTSCHSSGPSNPCSLSSFSKGFVYYVWVDDKGYGETVKEDGTKVDGKRPHRGKNINMIDIVGGNGTVDLWDTHYKVTVTKDSRTVQKITYLGTYDDKGALKYTVETLPQGFPAGAARNLTLEQEKQNIANWYQYYHRRLLTFKALIARMPYFAPNYRYGLMSLGLDEKKLIVARDSDLDPIKKLNGINPANQEFIFEFPLQDSTTGSVNLQQHNRNMLNALFKLSYFDATPMRETLNRAGKYFLYANSNGNPLVSGTKVDPITNACQRNYSLIITDGYYTTPTSSFTTIGENGASTTIGDEDQDGSSVTLADIARYYYMTDLRPSAKFPNILTPTRCDNRPAPYFPTRQHMVTFGISVGVDGKLIWGNEDKDDGWPNDIVHTPIKCPPSSTGLINDWQQTDNKSWADQPQSCSPNDCPKKIDDLWHAAYNSHGAYIPVKTPKDLEAALLKVLGLISTDKAFAASASSSSYYSSGSKVFLTSFESQYWTGDLKAYTVNATGDLNTDAQGNPISEWSAADKLNNTSYTQRTILSYDPVKNQAIPFESSQLDSSQQKPLNTLNSDGKGVERVQFLRGRGAGTGSNKDDTWISDNNFRIRPGVLGDIIQSDPVYVAQPYFRYDEYDEHKCPECPTYSNFKAKTRNAMVYVGANDGMLHGFDAANGQEKIAYIPGRLIDKLSSLTSRDYTHKYYVDGSATVGDAYFGAWHTVLAGSLRAGGQAVFALDITDPTSFSENNLSGTVLWEFSDDTDPDLGYTFSKPVIARLHNGKWAAIFGNGYNNTVHDGNNEDGTQRNGKTVVSSSGEAVLYIVYLDKNASPWFIKISTGEGKTADPIAKTELEQRPNGLATPAVMDFDDDLIADYVYAGDLFGNLWKFDIRDPDPSNWQKIKLFKAVDDNNTPQPITVRPVVNYHPYGKDFGYMIYFGTGKYFENDDNKYSNKDIQSFYGIWDKNVSSSADVFDRTGTTTDGTPVLFKQEIKTVSNKLRTISAINSAGIKWLDDKGDQYNKGWYMDFPLGEKQITNPTMFNKKVIFTTLVLPETLQSCDSDGSTSWLMVVDAFDGGIPNGGAFMDDSVSDNTVVGIVSDVGALPKPSLTIVGGGVFTPPALGTAGGETAGKFFIGKIKRGIDDFGRQSSWRQLWRIPR